MADGAPKRNSTTKPDVRVEMIDDGAIAVLTLQDGPRGTTFGAHCLVSPMSKR